MNFTPGRLHPPPALFIYQEIHRDKHQFPKHIEQDHVPGEKRPDQEEEDGRNQADPNESQEDPVPEAFDLEHDRAGR